MKKNIIHYGMIVVGLGMLIIGIFLVRHFPQSQGMIRALPYVCIGIGCGVFGNGMGKVIERRALKGSPDLQRQIDISKNDERNVAICSRAKAKAYDMMIYVFEALMVAFALMGVNMVAILLLVFSYLFVIGSSIYYRNQYDKQM